MASLFMSQIRTEAEQMEDGRWFVASPQTPGCWADGDTRAEAEEEFCDVFVGWYSLKAEDGDDDLPPMALTYTGGS